MINIQLFGGGGGNSGIFRYNLPKNPYRNKKWKDVTHPKQRANSNSREFYDSKTELRIRFDKGDPNKTGWRGKDHYHILNPKRTSNEDMYLDQYGNPCSKGSPESHLSPGQYENLLRSISND